MNDSESTGARSPLNEVDFDVLDRIQAMYGAADPVPAELYDRVLFAFDLDFADAELARLGDELAVGSLARGAERANTMTFESNTLTITVTVARTRSGGFRLDGWLVPAGSLRLELRTTDLRMQTMSDEAGRFVIDDVAPGEVQLAVHPTPGSTVALSKTVLTPPIVL